MGRVQYRLDLVFRTTLNQIEAQKWHRHSPCNPKDSLLRSPGWGDTEAGSRFVQNRRSFRREPCPLLDAQRAGRRDQDMVGITNSAPARMPVGQRLVIVFNPVLKRTPSG